MAERVGFEPMIRKAGFSALPVDYLLRNDWLSCLIGALLRLLGRGPRRPKGSRPAGWFARRG